ncbi:MAG: helix-turn-helix domain-containing protein [Phycisphaerae bacterium]|nr:helix-turn-helix domain-containing protein [Phycisphaerae bacterium]
MSKLVNADDVARRFGVTVATVRRWVRESRVPALRPSRRVVRFDLQAVESALSVPESVPRPAENRPGAPDKAGCSSPARTKGGAK